MTMSEDDLFHDFNERKYITVAGLHRVVDTSPGARRLNIGFIALVLTFNFYLIVMAFFSLYYCYVQNDLVETINSFHLVLLLLIALAATVFKLINITNLNIFNQQLVDALTIYDDEPADEEHARLLKEGVVEIRAITKNFTYLLGISITSNTVATTLLKLWMLEEDTGQKPWNPYLPQPIFMPFETRSTKGFIYGCIIDMVFVVHVCAIYCCMFATFFSCTIQYRSQFKILNHSLVTIETRALTLCNENLGSKLTGNPYESEMFQEYLNDCLKKNVKHHLALLDIKKTFEGYGGGSFLVVICLASLILAASVILLLENPGIYVSTNVIVTLTVELLYIFQYCYYGETLLGESGKLYQSLYEIPWTHFYNIKFKKMLLIMMMNTKIPVEIKTPGFNFNATLDTFGNIITTTYQIMNVIRNR